MRVKWSMTMSSLLSLLEFVGTTQDAMMSQTLRQVLASTTRLNNMA